MLTYQIGWFSTARGPTSRALLRATWDAIHGGDIGAEVAFVFCSREQGESEETDEFLEQVRSYGIALVTLSFARFRREQGGRGTGFDGAGFAPWREAYDQEVLRLLEAYRPDLVVLAGYMLVMTPALSSRFSAINLHPAAPGGPAGTWQQVIWRLIEERAHQSGVRMHLVTPQLDEGPVVTYCTYSLRGPGFDRLWEEVDDTPMDELKTRYGEELPLFKKIRQAGVARELPLMLATIKAFSEGRLRLHAGRPDVSIGGPDEGERAPAHGYDLTKEIEHELRVKSRQEG